MPEKLMTVKEFVDFGLLQEVNRYFFHPRGLALCASFETGVRGPGKLGVLDFRDEPAEKVKRVQALLTERKEERKNIYGFSRQPLVGEKIDGQL
jgi:hypothetical protein